MCAFNVYVKNEMPDNPLHVVGVNGLILVPGALITPFTCGSGQVLTLELQNQPSGANPVRLKINSHQNYSARVTQEVPNKKWIIELYDSQKGADDPDVNVTVGEDEGSGYQKIFPDTTIVLITFTIAWLVSPLTKSIDPGLWIAIPIITGIGALVTGIIAWRKKIKHRSKTEGEI